MVTAVSAMLWQLGAEITEFDGQNATRRSLPDVG